MLLPRRAGCCGLKVVAVRPTYWSSRALVANGQCDRGILVCGTGVGMAIAANKVPGVRSAAIVDTDTAKLAREHNDLNVLTLGARVTPEVRAREIVKVFLETAFAGGRHANRVGKIHAIER